MAHTVTGKLNKAANQFAAGESTGFGLRVGVRYYDRETQQNEWTNYEAVVFAKNPNQIAFYQTALVEGAIVEISGRQQKIRTFDGQNGQVFSIELLDASLGYIGTPGGQQPQQAPAQQYQQPQSGYQQQQPQYAPQQPAQPPHGYPQGNQQPGFQQPHR